MSANLILTLITLLIVKHFIVDFLLQPKWMWSNKGISLHPGGLAHAGLHGLVTFIILSFYVKYAFFIAFAEAVVHYVVDFLKMNINSLYGWTSANPKFWVALGVDQFLHYMTYVAIVWYLV